MAWEGKSLGQICEQIKDPARNGGKTLDEIWVMRPDGTGLANLTDNGDAWEDFRPAWSPDGVQIAFDATSAYVHAENSRKLNELGVLMIDLTPAAIGPFCVPPVNLLQHVGKGEMNVNMVTCGGQATIPMVAAVSRVQAVAYGEIVATVFFIVVIVRRGLGIGGLINGGWSFGCSAERTRPKLCHGPGATGELAIDFTLDSLREIEVGSRSDRRQDDQHH